MVDKNLRAVVETVTMPGEGVDQEIRPFIPADPVLSFQHRKKKTLHMCWAVRKIQRDFLERGGHTLNLGSKDFASPRGDVGRAGCRRGRTAGFADFHQDQDRNKAFPGVSKDPSMSRV